MDRGVWWSRVQGSRKKSDTTEQLTHTHTHSEQLGLASFSVIIDQSYVFFGEVSAYIFCLFLKLGCIFSYF